MKMNKVGTFLVVQGFSLNASNAGGLGLVSCFGELRSYICLMVWPSGEKKRWTKWGKRGYVVWDAILNRRVREWEINIE